MQKDSASNNNEFTTPKSKLAKFILKRCLKPPLLGSSFRLHRPLASCLPTLSTTLSASGTLGWLNNLYKLIHRGFFFSWHFLTQLKTVARFSHTREISAFAASCAEADCFHGIRLILLLPPDWTLSCRRRSSSQIFLFFSSGSTRYFTCQPRKRGVPVYQQSAREPVAEKRK